MSDASQTNKNKLQKTHSKSWYNYEKKIFLIAKHDLIVLQNTKKHQCHVKYPCTLFKIRFQHSPVQTAVAECARFSRDPAPAQGGWLQIRCRCHLGPSLPFWLPHPLVVARRHYLRRFGNARASHFSSLERYLWEWEGQLWLNDDGRRGREENCECWPYGSGYWCGGKTVLLNSYSKHPVSNYETE